jgi:hypothetical protein
MKSYLFFLLATISISIYSCKKVNGRANSGPNTNGSPQYVVSTFAGNGTAGFVNGMGQAAEFNHPFGITVDTSGNVFVADEGNNCIRKITPAGMVSTLAGTGTSGYADGPGGSALFNAPDGVAADWFGNVYVADVNNECIRKINSSGMVITYAGTAQQEGYLDSTGLAAQFAQPTGIVVVSYGFPYIIYVADAANECIRAIDYNGRVTTMVGDPGVAGFAEGAHTSAMFNNPMGIAVNATDDVVYVADVNNNRIREILGVTYAWTAPLAGDSTTGYADGTGSSAHFAGPTGITEDIYRRGQDLYVADAVGQSIRKVTLDGVVSIVAGDPLIPGFADGVGTSAKFSSPTGVAIDSKGNIYVADYINNCIRKIVQH